MFYLIPAVLIAVLILFAEVALLILVDAVVRHGLMVLAVPLVMGASCGIGMWIVDRKPKVERV